MSRFTLATCSALVLAPLAPADESAPKPVPVTRPEVKQALEDLKHRQPRLPLPPPTAEELAAWGGRPPVNNARMRQLHLPPELRDAGFVREPDPALTLDPTFKTLLFWVVS